MANRLETGSSPTGKEINKNPRGLIGQQVLFSNGPIGPAVEALPYFISRLSPGKSDFPNDRAIIVSLDDGRLVCAAKTEKSDKTRAEEASQRLRMVGEEIEVWYREADGTKSWKTHLEKLEEKKALQLRNLYHGLGINNLSLVYSEDLSPEAREQLGIKESNPAAVLPWKDSQEEGQEVKKREGRKGHLSSKVVRMLSAVAVAAVGIQGAKAVKAEGDYNLFGENAAVAKTNNGEVNTENNPELRLAVVPLDEVLAPEAQEGQLSVLTGDELSKEVEAFYEGTRIPLILVQKAYSQTQEAYLALGLPNDPDTNPLVPDIVETVVADKTTYDPVTGVLRSGTEHAFSWNFSFAFFVRDENRQLSLKKLPDVWLGKDKLLPYVQGYGEEAEIIFLDGNGREVATLGKLAAFSQEINPASPLRVMPAADGSVGVIRVQVPGYGGMLTGGGEVNSDLIEKNGSQSVESDEQQTYTLQLNDLQSFVVSLPKVSIPVEGLAFSYDAEKERFDVKNAKNGATYGIVDKDGNYWFTGTPKGATVNVRQTRSTSAEVIGRYTSGQEILVVGKMQEGAYYWYKTNAGGFVRDDVVSVSDANRIPVLTDAPDPTGVKKVTLLPLAAAAEASSMSNATETNIGVPSEALLNRLGVTLEDVRAASVEKIYADTGELNKVRVYDAENNPLMVAEYNPETQVWEWKEAALDGVSLPSQEIINVAVAPYAKAFEFNDDEVTSRLVFQRLNDNAGVPFVVSIDKETGVPLLIASQEKDGEWKWKAATARNILDKVDVEIGTSVSAGQGEGWNSTYYKEVAYTHFSILKAAPFYTISTLQNYPMLAGQGNSFAKTHDMALYAGAMFSHHESDIDPELLSGDVTKDEVVESMRNRVQVVLRNIKAAGRGHVDILSEAMWASGGNTGWENSVYYNTFGQNLIVEIYVMAYEIATQEYGMEVGKDVVFLYNDYHMEIPGAKSRFVYSNLARSKTAIAERLGIPESEVRLGIGLEYHIAADRNQPQGIDATYSGDLTKEGIIENINLFSQIGDVYITELQVNLSDDQQYMQQIIKLVMEAALESGKVKGITLYESLRFKDIWLAINSGMFKDDLRYELTSFYYELLATYYSYLLRQQLAS